MKSKRKVVIAVVAILLIVSMLLGLVTSPMKNATTVELNDEENLRIVAEESAGIASNYYIAARMMMDQMLDKKYKGVDEWTYCNGIDSKLLNSDAYTVAELFHEAYVFAEYSEDAANKYLREYYANNSEALGRGLGDALMGLFNIGDDDLESLEGFAGYSDNYDEDDSDYSKAEELAYDMEECYEEFDSGKEILKYASRIKNDSKKMGEIFSTLSTESKEEGYNAKKCAKEAKKAVKEAEKLATVKVYVNGLKEEKGYSCENLKHGKDLFKKGGYSVKGVDALIFTTNSSSCIVVGKNNQVTIGWSELDEISSSRCSVAALTKINKGLNKAFTNGPVKLKTDKFSKLTFIADNLGRYKTKGKFICNELKPSFNNASMKLSTVELKTSGASKSKVKKMFKKIGFDVPSMKQNVSNKSLLKKFYNKLQYNIGCNDEEIMLATLYYDNEYTFSELDKEYTNYIYNVCDPEKPRVYTFDFVTE